MTSYALYRMPHSKQATLVAQLTGEPEQLSSCRELSGRQGFVMAPFAVGSDEPLLLIRPDVVETSENLDGLLRAIPEFAPRKLPVCSEETHGTRASYGADFRRFHERLMAGDFRKIVLSRCDVQPRGSDDEQPIELFRKACARYPRLFVALVFTPQSGLWLTATPEVLLNSNGEQWHTIALAGTMRLEGADLQGEGQHVRWSTKNIEEQRLVATYIKERLQSFAAGISEEGPRTVRAANLVHLRSDFTFFVKDEVREGDLIAALHPTPAVCGLPKQETFQFIVDNEHTPRRYYSGFMGPLNMPTALFVSLRCMQITDDAYRLYAGGGLLRDSQEEQEWMETEAKMQTRRELMGG